MIIVLLVVITLITYFGGVYVRNRHTANWIRVIGDVLIVGVLALMVANDTYHFGMQPKTQTSTMAMTSVNRSSQMPMLLYQSLGTSGKNKVYLYKTSSTAKVQHTNPEQTSDQIIRTNAQARLVSQKKVWSYKNGFYRTLFGISGNEGEHIQTTNKFFVPQNWAILSTKQAKKLARNLRNPQMQKQLTQQVQHKLLVTLQKQPTMTKAQQRVLAAKYQRQAVEKLAQ
ncbi:DUF4811 domain-containing protein [Bombilactobacillus bombi]|uniref:DUF4811 domain-containing protein n=1 Tax=Bombilactobacillus bombi TaxID=1303590 RepID=UPI000E58CDD8|nr:DUF4811 domain-containing protein [Bombilactobacillus bombi]AXX64029.1 DUF4811 domain-containing protein [Bombilactobacillus bombi]